MENMKKKAAAFIDAHQTDMTALWQELVTTESGSTHKEGVDAVAAMLEQRLSRWGAATKIVTMERAGNMLIATFGADRKKAPVLLLGHMDTVFPTGTLSKRPFRIEAGKAYGPGILDMKGGIVIALYAMKALEEVYEQTMPDEMGYDYAGMSFQEKKAQQGVSATTIFAVSLLFVFLILAALYENQAGFFGAQMAAMDNATRNAGDLINSLTLQYNRKRQAQITTELIEIIAGAEAL